MDLSSNLWEVSARGSHLSYDLGVLPWDFLDALNIELVLFSEQPLASMT